MKKLRIFLTGKNGFIGRNIVEQLKDKYTFFAPSHHQLDLVDTKAVEGFFRKHHVDIVIHSAKIGGSRKIESSAEIGELNARMFFNLARNEKYFKKMIFLGSGAEYDNSRPLKQVKESDFDQVVPQEKFFFYKYICSKYIEKADKIINLRLFGIFGKYEDYEVRFISNAICRNLSNLPITMEQNVFFDYLYINDFTKILDYFINNNSKYKFYNVGTGKRIDLLTVAKIINKISERKSKIIVKKRGLKREYSCDNSRLKKEIRNLSFTDIEDSIRQLYLWYKENKKKINTASLLFDNQGRSVYKRGL